MINLGLHILDALEWLLMHAREAARALKAKRKP